MSQPETVSVDAMGGDHGPRIIIEGIDVVLKRRPNISPRFLVHGDEAVLAPLVAAAS
ncbi:MAG TPA: phosphate acyltransferase, partial [Alphaproteobacteria bacterium]|nr:phosphate acyltransferase [Alphaproteobacteria bacterium]